MAAHAGPRTRIRMRSASVALGFTALMATSLTRCSSSADHAAVCVDPETQVRVQDLQCSDDTDYNPDESSSGAGYHWYYLGSSSRVPAVGQMTTGGTWNGRALSGSVQRGGLPITGGSSVKSSTRMGGFGGSGRGFG